MTILLTRNYITERRLKIKLHMLFGDFDIFFSFDKNNQIKFIGLKIPWALASASLLGGGGVEMQMSLSVAEQ